MSPTLDWTEILLRLALTVLGGSLIGLNRGERGHAAGLRTTLLVCLAASISMIQVNLLLAIRGKTQDSFAVLDLMRLPLGILTGMGFIGGGAILKKENMVMGVTTAATLWFVTVMGLCFGGGQLALGLASLCLSLAILSVLKHVESRLKQDRRAALKLTLKSNGPSNAELKRIFEDKFFHVLSWDVVAERDTEVREVNLMLQRAVHPSDAEPPTFITDFLDQLGISKVEWHDLGA